MGDQTLSGALEEEHRDIDRGIESFTAGLVEGEDRQEALTAALGRLRRHIYFEEEHLFPPLAAAGLVPPLFVMRREHGEIWRILDTLSAGLASGAAPTALLDTCRELVATLETHNTKEEAVVYATADQVIVPPACSELLAELDSAQLPPGWVCQALRS